MATEREAKRLIFIGLIEKYGLTRKDTAELLHSSLDRIKSWCKPQTSKSSYPVPVWAIELLRFKAEERAEMDDLNRQITERNQKDFKREIREERRKERRAAK